MKILHTVEQYDPSVGGMQEVVKQLSRRLSALGHEVVVATSFHPDRKANVLDGVKIESFRIGENLVRGYKGEVTEIKRYQDFLVNSDFDVVVNFAAQQWASDLAFPVLNKIKAKKVFVPTGFSGFFLEEYREYYHKMQEWMKLYDMNIFLSDDYWDINFARKNNVSNIMIIPNGAGEDEFLKPELDIKHSLGIKADDFFIVHIGSHTGVKGHKEAVEIFSQADIKNATFLIIGNFFPKEKVEPTSFINRLKGLVKKIIWWLIGGHDERCPEYCHKIEKKFNSLPAHRANAKRLIVKSLSRPEAVSALQEANLFLFPSNIECSPIVLFEAMAARTAFLTTDVGNSKEIVAWSGGGEILPTTIDKNGFSYAKIKDSADLLKSLFADRSRLNELADSGYQAWRDHFTWEKITKKYEDLYVSLINNKI